MHRRPLLLATAAALLAPRGARAFDYPAVLPRPLVFPRDHGAHPDYRTEWWYLTGWLDGGATPLGFQITFFRTRPPLAPGNPSRFAATQLIIGHAALADPARGSLLHDERIARAGFGLAFAAEGDTDVGIDGWRLRRSADSSYTGEIAARGFRLRLTATPTQPLLLQGEAGFSRKGPQAVNASYYYSQPQLRVAAELTRDGRPQPLGGTAWLDHEWSSTLLDPDAAGWDWVGMNLADGGALTAFRIRDRRPQAAPRFASASLRGANGALRIYSPGEVAFATLTEWRSPRSRTPWPVAQQITVGGRTFATQPLLDDQELDSRATTGNRYWEGASTLLEAGRPVGRGYLEMTGYAAPVVL
jgi:predicted secreted hydrolase